jgi:adenylate kinase
LIIMGPPGAGKGTQAERIAEHFGIPAISTGDIFRANIKAETELGKQVEAILATGGYVPDELTNAMVATGLAEADCAPGFLLDGYPRTVGQLHTLDAHLEETGRQIDAALELVVDEDAMVARLLARAADQGRADDTEEVIRERMSIYRAATAPLTAIYGDQGKLRQVDGMGDIDEITARIVAALADLQG